MSEDRYGTWEWSGEYPYYTSLVPFGDDREASLVIFNDQDSYGGKRLTIILLLQHLYRFNKIDD